MESPKENLFRKPWVQSVAGISIVLVLAGAALIYKYLTTHISIDTSQIQAPVISIGPEASGILDAVYVKAGDQVTEGETLARIGGEILTAKIPGTVIEVNNTPGQIFAPSQAVVKMIDPSELRVVGTIKENEGLADIAVGDPVSFTVDAFGSRKFTGVVESISPTSKESQITFSISDKREIREFDVKVKYDVAANPEFKNGMSAKMKVYQK